MAKKIWKIVNISIAVVAVILLWIASTAFDWKISKQVAYIALGIGAVIAFFALLMFLIRSLTTRKVEGEIRSDVRLKILIRKVFIAAIVFLVSLLISVGLMLLVNINYLEMLLVTFLLFIGLLFLKEYFFPSPYIYPRPSFKVSSKPAKSPKPKVKNNGDVNKRIHQIYTKKQVSKSGLPYR